MPAVLLRLVLLVSCAHALVHVYELAFSSTEQLIADEFSVDTATTGKLGTCFRLPFGLFALLVGLLVDRLGARLMLTAYLAGCAGSALLVALVPSLPLLYLAMFALGSFASIYHPAGLALISQATSPENRPRALGTHGIFGSLGIGGAPFAAGLVLSLDGASWRTYYLLLAVPGILLAGGLWHLLRQKESGPGGPGSSSGPRPHRSSAGEASPGDPAANQPEAPDKAGEASPGHLPDEPAAVHIEDRARWKSFFVLTLFGATSGFIYAAFLTFLPRYMHGAELSLASIPAAGLDNYLAGGALLLGVIGQYTAGRIARPDRLERLLALVLLANAPLLVWMAFAQGSGRAAAASVFALIHFMNQPLYNSLIASYTPRRKRSLCYGFSFLMSFGVGSLGAWYAGQAESELANYGTLACLALFAASLAALLHYWNRPRSVLADA